MRDFTPLKYPVTEKSDENSSAFNGPLNSTFYFPGPRIEPLKWKMYTKSHIPALLNTYWPRSHSIDALPFYAAATVLPMRTNNYVVSHLIDWSAVPDDPMFQLTFPQPGDY